MTTERAWVVGLRPDAGHEALLRDIDSAISRSRKADAGDRLDIARMEALATRLEQAALADPAASRIEVPVPEQAPGQLVLGTDPTMWPSGLVAAADACVAAGTIPVLVVDPFGRGETVLGGERTAQRPAERWDSGGEHGRRAVEKRFRAQFLEALGQRGGRRVAIMPSGISNRVVTEALREFVVEQPGTDRRDVSVEYRDGSRSAHPFPLRSLSFREHLRPPTLQLRFALLSIRHTEMDAVVDGTWLRNAEISRPRPAAQTDDLVYAISRDQLDELCRGERHVRLTVYQTGLETAVVGFYRALADHLLAHPGSVSVQPMYFEAPPPPKKKAGRGHQPSAPIVESTLYRKGMAWAS